MPNAPDFVPQWSSPPGETISDILTMQGLSRRDFAHAMSFTASDVETLLQGRRRITNEIAHRLKKTLGVSIQFWLRRDRQYLLDLSRLEATEWLKILPVTDMLRFGWIKGSVPDRLASCLQFFEVSNPREWHTKYAGMISQFSFRTSPSFSSYQGSLVTWLRQAERATASVQCARWNPERFEAMLSKARSLSIKKHPHSFIPILTNLCAECGVALATVRAPSGCRASGATRFLSKTRALLLLSFRYLSNDHLWFSFFHEAGHLLLHDKRGVFVEGVDGSLSRREREANTFATNILIPPEHQSNFRNLKTTRNEIIKFARLINIHPGVVVGQLQFIGRLRRTQLNSLKRHFVWSP